MRSSMPLSQADRITMLLAARLETGLRPTDFTDQDIADLLDLDDRRERVTDDRREARRAARPPLPEPSSGKPIPPRGGSGVR